MARGRNLGFSRLLELEPAVRFVQFMDGDCELVEGWLERAQEAIGEHPEAAIVCGRRRERNIDHSIYNRLADLDWDTPLGVIKYSGGDTVTRVEAFRQVGGYMSDLIAGEDPEICVRLRQRGWTILRIDADMTLHDIAMTRLQSMVAAYVSGLVSVTAIACDYMAGLPSDSVFVTSAASGSGVQPYRFSCLRWSGPPEVPASHYCRVISFSIGGFGDMRPAVDGHHRLPGFTVCRASWPSFPCSLASCAAGSGGSPADRSNLSNTRGPNEPIRIACSVPVLRLRNCMGKEVEIVSDAQAVDSITPASVRLDYTHGMNLSSERASSDPDLPPLNLGEKNLNPTGIGFLALLGEDLRTYKYDLTEPGLWAVAIHRFGNWRMSIHPKLLRAPFSLTFRFLSRLAELVGGIHLPYTVQLGRRVRIWHHGGIVLHARSIGDDVHIRQNTTFGVALRDQDRSIPTIEDRVDIGCGACVLGAVTIGHDSLIGANAVVVTDIPAHSTAVGVPARVIRRSPPDKCTL